MWWSELRDRKQRPDGSADPHSAAGAAEETAREHRRRVLSNHVRALAERALGRPMPGKRE